MTIQIYESKILFVTFDVVIFLVDSWECGWYFTEWNNDGTGDAKYLIYHNINCPKQQVITFFQLQRNSANQYRYKYKCCPARDTCSYSEKATPYKSAANPMTLANLGSHDLDCGMYSYLASFRLEKQNNRHYFRYKYSCCNLKRYMVCTDKVTGKSTTNTLLSLYKHPVECSVTSSNSFGLQRFKLNYLKKKKSKNKWSIEWKYNYRCCEHVAEQKSKFFFLSLHSLGTYFPWGQLFAGKVSLPSQ